MSGLNQGKMQLSGRGVVCVRGGREVFSGLDFEAVSGEAVAVVGRNGSGKTSLLRLIAGLLIPAGGTIALDGGDAELTLPEQCHYLGHRDALKPALSVAENLSFWADFLGGERSDAGREPRHRRARSRHPFAGRLPVRRPAPPAVAGPAADGAPPGLAAGRADHGAGRGRPGHVRGPDAGASGPRRHDHRGDPCAARHRFAGAEDWGNEHDSDGPSAFQAAGPAPLRSLPPCPRGRRAGEGRERGATRAL